MTNLITLAEYKAAKSITKTDQDAVIEGLITTCSAIVTKIIEKSFYAAATTVTEVLDIDYESDVIYLENFPINSVTSVTAIDPETNDSTVFFPVSASTQYSVNLAYGSISRIDGINWPQGRAAVTVVYSVGSAPVSVPAELKQVTIDIVTYYLKEEWKESRTMMGASMRNEPIYSSSTKFPPHIQRILDLYGAG